MIQDLKVFHHLVKMVLQQLIKEFLLVVKKMTNVHPWSVQADKITYDKNKKQILYDKALIKVYDIPVIYFPKFFHPGPTVKRQSGLLVPHINNSNILGSSLQIPYFHVFQIIKILHLNQHSLIKIF
jgi:LPS-assembly protein